MLHCQHHATYVGIENGCELLAGHVFDSDQGSANARIVDEAVQSTEPVDGMVDHRHHARLISHIGAYEAQSVATFRLERTTFLDPSSCGDDPCPFRNEDFGDALANPTCGARHDGDFSVKLAHDCFSRSPCHNVRCSQLSSRVNARQLSRC